MAPKTKRSENMENDKIKTFSLGSSSDTLELSKDVARFIKENSLFQNIQGKQFVNVEGWQYAGSRLGLYCVVEEPIKLDRAGEIAYSCYAKTRDANSGEIVSAGFAVCSNTENGKKYYQEYAIASMAQTRAVGKAFRNILAWVIRAAGYEPTPAEEMDSIEKKPEKVSAKSTPDAPAPRPAEPAPAPQQPAPINPPAMEAGVKEWFDDHAKPEEEIERIAAECDLAACTKWLTKYRTKKLHRAKLEELFVSITSGKCKAAPIDPRPTKTDPEFKEMLADLESRSDLDGTIKAIETFKMRSAVLKAFNDLKAKLEEMFADLGDLTPEAGFEAENGVNDGGLATSKQKERIIKLVANPVVDRALKTQTLLGINLLTSEQAEEKIQKLEKMIG